MMVLACLEDLQSNVGMLWFKVILDLKCVLGPHQLIGFPFQIIMVLMGLGDLKFKVGMLRCKVILECECVLGPHQLM